MHWIYYCVAEAHDSDTQLGVLPDRHYSDVIISAMASQITDVLIVCSTVNSDADQRKHQSSSSLAFVRWPVNSPHKGPETRKMLTSSWVTGWPTAYPPNKKQQQQTRTTSKLRIIGSLWEDSTMTGLSWNASNAEKVFMPWRHHASTFCVIWRHDLKLAEEEDRPRFISDLL